MERSGQRFAARLESAATGARRLCENAHRERGVTGFLGVNDSVGGAPPFSSCVPSVTGWRMDTALSRLGLLPGQPLVYVGSAPKADTTPPENLFKLNRPEADLGCCPVR